MAINLQKQSEPSSPIEPTNSSRNSSERYGIGIDLNASQDLGTWGGINVEAEAKVSVDIEAEIRSQGLTFNTDPNTGSMSLGAGLGSAKGKLGGNIGVELGIDDEGNVEITGARGAVSIAGFGGSIEANRDGSGSLGAEIGGFGVEVSRDEEGKPSLTLSYGFGPGEVSITFSPNEEKEVPAPTVEQLPNDFNPNKYALNTTCNSNNQDFRLYVNEVPHSEGLALEFATFFANSTNPNAYNLEQQQDPYAEDIKRANAKWGDRWRKVPHDYSYTGWKVRSYYFANPGGIYRPYNPASTGIVKLKYTYKGSLLGLAYPGTDIFYDYFYGWTSNHKIEIVDLILPYCPGGALQDNQVPVPAPPKLTPLILPDYPQHPKRMDCCEKVEEIYQFLGIAKLKKRKFKVAKQFLAPGGTGTEDCEDYYQIAQALFRMLANGLIINPKSQPLGSKWQNVNATAWASQMYEMMAESMSDGNSTQRVEISTIMQLVQMMSLLAETSRKVELIIDALNIEPNLVPEDLSVCFTVHESHKGFQKKEPKKIDTTKLKTDNDVEAVLGKMLAPSKIPIVKWEFKPGTISVIEALKNGN